AGLGLLAVVATWCSRFGALPLPGSVLIVVCALAGVAYLAGVPRRRPDTSGLQALLLLLAGTAVPCALLGAAFAGLEAPLSTHDGAFHVETVDALRHGIPRDTWYPIGFHALAAATLGLAPWL